jgi:hypothetical protein
MDVHVRRRLLGGIIGLGLVFNGVSATGVLAPVSDVARTGVQEKEHVETGVFAPAGTVDLQLATNRDGSCGPFSDDLATPVFSVSDITDTWFQQTRWLCIRNAGTDAVRVGVRVLGGSLVFTDTECSPGEDAEPGGCTDDGLSSSLEWEVAVLGFGPVGCPDMDEMIGSGLLSGDTAHRTSVVLPVGLDCQYGITVGSVGGQAAPSLTAADQTDSLQWQFQVFTL